ncbi:hypothetical protein GGI02_005337 [Coemansia sp. RSA 2322]|nr:hypothetical protein GGI02_005337 [Coemansia sp. RSA 2322]
MGQPAPAEHYAVDPDRLSHQLGKKLPPSSAAHHHHRRQRSQHSVMAAAHKNYAIRDDFPISSTDTTPAEPPRLSSYRRTATKFKSYRIPAAHPHQSSVRDLSSKLKSACRKLNPKRLAKLHHHHSQELEEEEEEDPEPPLPDRPHAEAFGGVSAH